MKRFPGSSQRSKWRTLMFLIVSTFLFYSSSETHLPSGTACYGDGMAPYVQVDGVGTDALGAGMSYADINKNGKTDLVLMAYDNSGQSNAFRYKIGWDISLNDGKATGWTAYKQVAGIGQKGEGAGMDVYDINRNGTPDLILVAYENMDDNSVFRYKIGWDVDVNGNAGSWSANYIEVKGVGAKTQGIGVSLADIDQNGVVDMILLASNSYSDFNYRIGWDINAAGIAQRWENTTVYAGRMGDGAEGSDVAVADVNMDGIQDIILMTYHNPGWPGWNNFRYQIGWSVQANGRPLRWSRWFMTKGVGMSGQGAGMDILPDPERGNLLALMAYDNPSGNNSFRYMILPMTTSGTTFGLANDAPPYPDDKLDVPVSNSTLTPARLLNLNMEEVQETAEDALALYLFGCLLTYVYDQTEINPDCWCNYPMDHTNAIIPVANAGTNYTITPDILVNAVSSYINYEMGWVEDAANSYVLNDINGRNYYSGAENMPAYYTIHYTNPAHDPNLIDELRKKEPKWANAYNDGRLFHGDCEDFAIMRHALLRSLGFNRNYIWHCSAPSHGFNAVLYQGSYRIMDYGPIYSNFCKPSPITVDIFGAWNTENGPLSDQGNNLREQLLQKVYPDRCPVNRGWMFTRRPNSEFSSGNNPCCD